MPQGISFDGLVQAIDRISIVSQIPLSILEENGETVYCVPNSYHHYLNQTLAKKEIDVYKQCALQENFPLMHDLELGLIIGLIPITNSQYLFVGPIGPNPVSFESLSSHYGRLLTHNEMLAIFHILNQSMKCDSVRFANILSSLSFSLHQDNILPMEIIQRSFSKGLYDAPDNSPVPADTVPLNTREQATSRTLPVDMESVRLFESNIVAAICFGNLDAIEGIWNSAHLATNEYLDSPDKFQQYFTIPILTLMSRAATSSGADAGKSFFVFDDAMSKVKNVKHLSDALTLCMEASFQFCNLVRDATGRSNLPEACRMCESYINDHIAEKITADDLAKLCGLSKKKMYEVFEAYFHTTINDYIQRVRLRRARVLMESSNYTLAQISSALGYASQSYFTSVFSKYYGYTPGEYQAMKKYEVFPEGTNIK